ncbi:hypothetical protein D3C85_964990 [compost metagenome]
MTPSMHRRAFAAVRRPRHAVTLGAQLIKDIQHGFLARVHEGAAGDVLGVLQQLFGFGHFGSRRVVDAKHFGPKPPCNSSCNAMNFSY